jgi:GNAT superfamily N-acetyltransferase
LSLLETVKPDFYDLDLANEEKHRNFLLRNIERGTAIYIEEGQKIIGGMVYSPNSSQISWLGVDPEYRRKGIGTLLVNYMFEILKDRKEFMVKTFIEEHWQSKTSHPFYRSLGFEPKEINYENMESNANHPMLVFVKNKE